MKAADAILTALIEAGKRIGCHRFTTAEVTVAAYGFDPQRFAMRGHAHAHLPDSKRVSMELAKMRQRGHIRLIAQGVWIVTEAGYERVRGLAKGAA